MAIDKVRGGVEGIGQRHRTARIAKVRARLAGYRMQAVRIWLIGAAVPLVVLTRGRTPPPSGDPNVDARNGVWLDLQRDWATRSPKAGK